MTPFDIPWIPVIEGDVRQWAFALALMGLAWAFHVGRLRTRERRLLAAFERAGRERPAAPPVPPSPVQDDPLEVGARSAGGPQLRVLVVAQATARDELARRLESQGLAASFADSAWSARAAWQDAIGDERPYNLVLVDEACGEFGVSGLAGELQREFERDGPPVGTIRGRPLTAAEAPTGAV